MPVAICLISPDRSRFGFARERALAMIIGQPFGIRRADLPEGQIGSRPRTPYVCTMVWSKDAGVMTEKGLRSAKIPLVH